MIKLDDRIVAAMRTLQHPSLFYVMTSDQIAAEPQAYVYLRELSSLKPWTEQAIRTMMAQRIQREGEHFLHVGRRLVFKWEAIVRFIERRDAQFASGIPLHRGGFLNGGS